MSDRTPAWRDVRLAPKRFYWGGLDASGLPRRSGGKPRTDALGYLFEGVLPVPIETVHAVYVPTGEGRWLACGMDRAALDAEREGAIALGPAALPAWADAPGVVPGSINLLRGPLEPAPLRRLRRARAIVVAGAIALMTGLACVGLERRAAAHRETARAAEAAVAGVHERVLPPGASAQPAAVRMIAELRRLRQTRAAPVGTDAFDAAGALGIVLASWPAIDTPTRTEQLLAGEEGVTVVAQTDDHDGAQALTAALASVDGWRVRTSNATRTPDGVRVRVVLAPEERAERAAGRAP